MYQERWTNNEIDSPCTGVFKLPDGREIEVQGKGGRSKLTFTNGSGEILGQGEGIIFEPSSGEIVPNNIYFHLTDKVEGLPIQPYGPALLDVYVNDGLDFCERILTSPS